MLKKRIGVIWRLTPLYPVLSSWFTGLSSLSAKSCALCHCACPHALCHCSPMPCATACDPMPCATLPSCLVPLCHHALCHCAPVPVPQCIVPLWCNNDVWKSVFAEINILNKSYDFCLLLCGPPYRGVAGGPLHYSTSRTSLWPFIFEKQTNNF